MPRRSARLRSKRSAETKTAEPMNTGNKRNTKKTPVRSRSKSTGRSPTKKNWQLQKVIEEEEEEEQEVQKTAGHEKHDGFPYEFGGPIGAVSTSIALPLVCYGFVHFCDKDSCPNMDKVSGFLSNPVGSATTALRLLPDFCTTQGFAVVFGW
jgi:hypothetical protein